MTPKEALKNIESTLRGFDCITNDLFPINSKEIECLKSALNRLEELENDYCKVVEQRGKWQEQSNKKIKELKKVLKIVKEKDVLSSLIQEATDVDEYNGTFYTKHYYLTETEFNLLKEYLK